MPASILVIKREALEPYIHMGDCVSLVEGAFAAASEGTAELPTKYHFRGDASLWFFMGGSIAPQKAMGVKLGCALAGQVSAQVFCYDAETGVPLALMDGMWVTALRTGAAAAVGAKYLARPESSTVGIVGAGKVGWSSLTALHELFPLERAHIADADEGARSTFVNRARAVYSFPVMEATVEEAVRAADILITATPSRQPIVQAEWVVAGTHISAMGADGQGKQELDSAIHQTARILCDSVDQCLRWGDINNSIRTGLLSPDHLAGEIGEVILDRKQGRSTEEDITLFDATGLGIQDAAVARLIYDTALREGLGTRAEL
jgi:alanine dehydrogenase